MHVKAFALQTSGYTNLTQQAIIRTDIVALQADLWCKLNLGLFFTFDIHGMFIVEKEVRILPVEPCLSMGHMPCSTVHYAQSVRVNIEKIERSVPTKISPLTYDPAALNR